MLLVLLMLLLLLLLLLLLMMLLLCCCVLLCVWGNWLRSGSGTYASILALSVYTRLLNLTAQKGPTQFWARPNWRPDPAQLARVEGRGRAVPHCAIRCS